MEDIEMNNNKIEESSNKIENEKKEIKDSYEVLDDIQKELNAINSTFLVSLNNIKIFAPFIEKGNEKNMEKTQNNSFRNIPNYDEQRNNFDNMVNTYSDQMNEHFTKILDLTKSLNNFEEFKCTEEELKDQLNNLKEKNINSTNTMQEKLKTIEKFYNELNTSNSMEKEIKGREQFDEFLDYEE